LPERATLFRAYQLQRRKDRALAARRTFEPELDLYGIELKVFQDTAKRVAMHAEFARGLALVSAVVAQDLLNIPAAKFADGFLIADTAGVHLHDQVVQLAFHWRPHLRINLKAAAISIVKEERSSNIRSMMF
jgi:hypothetical protein